MHGMASARRWVCLWLAVVTPLVGSTQCGGLTVGESERSRSDAGMASEPDASPSTPPMDSGEESAPDDDSGAAPDADVLPDVTVFNDAPTPVDAPPDVDAGVCSTA